MPFFKKIVFYEGEHIAGALQLLELDSGPLQLQLLLLGGHSHLEHIRDDAAVSDQVGGAHCWSLQQNKFINMGSQLHLGQAPISWSWSMA